MILDEETREIKQIYRDLCKADNDFAESRKVDEARRIEVHLKIAKSSAFLYFVEFSKANGSSCDMRLYE